MIIDTLKNAELYYCLNQKMKIAFKYLQETDLSRLQEGKHKIDGDDVFALVLLYDSKPLQEGKWEAHRKYIDIQYIFDGTEKMGYANMERMKVIQEYDQDKDILFADGEGSFITIEPGMYAIFTPHDAHMPGIINNKPQQIKKVVVKVLLD